MLATYFPNTSKESSVFTDALLFSINDVVSVVLLSSGGSFLFRDKTCGLEVDPPTQSEVDDPGVAGESDVFTDASM